MGCFLEQDIQVKLQTVLYTEQHFIGLAKLNRKITKERSNERQNEKKR